MLARQHWLLGVGEVWRAAPSWTAMWMVPDGLALQLVGAGDVGDADAVVGGLRAATRVTSSNALTAEAVEKVWWYTRINK